MAEGGGYFCEFAVEDFLSFRFDVETQERFGVAGPAVKPPVFESYGDTIEVVNFAAGIFFFELGHFLLFVFDFEVYFAAVGVSFERLDELAEGQAGLAENVEDVDEGDKSRIGIKIIAVVEVSGELACEDGVGISHSLFYEGVSDAFSSGDAAVCDDFLRDDKAASEVIDDDRFRRGLQEVRGKKCGQ